VPVNAESTPPPADTRSAGEITLTLAFDMRAPAWGTDPATLYAAALEQSEWADKLGFTDVQLMEHHASSDGYLPSPIVLGSAIAGVTSRLDIRLCLVLLPLYDPIRIAEDLAVLDLVSGGRLRLTVGLGYREEEYLQFGVDMKRRPSLMEEAIETLKLAWTGEPFPFRGRQVQVLPRPAQRPRPQIAMGGASPASAKRAARIADSYLPVAPRLYEIYREELSALGKAIAEPSPQVSTAGDLYVFVADDPDREWELIARHAAHDTREYAGWIAGRRGGGFSALDDVDDLRRNGNYRVWTPTECVDHARRHGSVVFKPLVGGLDPDVGWRSLHLFADKVLPHLRDPESSAPGETDES
jgi:alkanesulfonate monooxygenase SsuD/methylene tetrahydromethanopterin reductase-like flavin-dependent oxidoreductase (luciferase family)